MRRKKKALQQQSLLTNLCFYLFLELKALVEARG